MDKNTIVVAFSGFNDKCLNIIDEIDSITIEEVSEVINNMCIDLNSIYLSFNSDYSPYYLAEANKEFKKSCAILEDAINIIDNKRPDWLRIKYDTKLALKLHNVHFEIMAIFK